jgi:putative tricarboxylic transport membrane protein
MLIRSNVGFVPAGFREGVPVHLPDRLTGLFVGALGVLAAYGGSRLPPIPGQQVGPSAFPILIGIGLVVSGGLIAASFGRRFEEDAEAVPAALEEVGSTRHHPRGLPAALRLVVPPALLLLYATVADTVGFLSTAGLMVLVLSLVLRARLRLAVPLAVLAPIGAQLLFGKLLGVALPPGLLSIPW